MAKEIISEVEKEEVLKNGTTVDMEEVTRIDPTDPNYKETQDVPKNSQFDPTSVNYNEKLDEATE